MRAIDSKSIPMAHGVYIFIDQRQTVLYVGKSTNLKQRICTHLRSASGKDHEFYQRIDDVRWYVCQDENAALQLETKLIQSLKPEYNTDAKYNHLYQTIALHYDAAQKTLYASLTNKPEALKNFDLYGVYRAKRLTREAFYALTCCLEHLGRRLSTTEIKASQFNNNALYGFKNITAALVSELRQALAGQSNQFLALLCLQLIEKNSARKTSPKVTKNLKTLRLFFNTECKKLARQRKSAQYSEVYVDKNERDLLKLMKF